MRPKSYQLSAISYQLRAIGYWLLLIGGASPLHGQGLPPYAPISPIAQARTGLETQPYVGSGRRWHFTFLNDYANEIEYEKNGAYLLDAEVLRAQLTVIRNLGRHGFVLAAESFNGGYNGFLDGFLDWYHRLLGVQVAGRAERPKNQFGYEINLAGGRSYRYQPASGFLGDLKLGGGLRHSKHWQSTLAFTLPTSSTPAGYRKGTWSVNLVTTLSGEFANRFLYEGNLGAGYTPSHGELAAVQHTTFLLVAQGLRMRISGALHAYGNMVYHSSYYHDTGFQGLDGRELSIDLGGMLRFRRGPEWIFGLVEDLEPSGPAIDVVFRLGARW
jgi:hypothetical protein